jgi:hypothetical protein
LPLLSSNKKTNSLPKPDSPTRNSRKDSSSGIEPDSRSIHKASPRDTLKTSSTPSSPGGLRLASRRLLMLQRLSSNGTPSKLLSRKELLTPKSGSPTKSTAKHSNKTCKLSLKRFKKKLKKLQKIWKMFPRPFKRGSPASLNG